MHFDFQLSDTPITSTAGLAFIGQQLSESKFKRHLASICPHQRPGGRISDVDIAKSMIGLMCVGKPHFHAISEYHSEPFFGQALGIEKLPSAEILRQRIQAMPEDAGTTFRDFTTRTLRAHSELLTETIHGVIVVPIHVDVVAMDNSGSNKEGVSWTYRGFDGYAPAFAYIGSPGLMLNNQLREGSAHCNCEGTGTWFEQTLEMAASITDHRRLLVTDAGHDSGKNIRLFDQTPDTDFVIKRNPRKEDPAEWLALAQKYAKEKDNEQTEEKYFQKLDIGAQIWYAERELALPGQTGDDGNPIKKRVTYRVIDRFADKDTGQLLTIPKVTIEAYWTSLRS